MSSSVSTSTTTAISAPGKVLLAGGYLVLDHECKGLVFGLSARIHAIATPDGALLSGQVVISSPQFANATWEYSTKLLDDGRGVEVKQTNLDKASKNIFVETTLRYVLSYLNLPQIPSTKILVLADNDYYSQPSISVPRFNALDVPISAANKTGLGSSAALVTSLTTCLLQHLSPNTTDRKLPLRTIHNLAQTAHCAAQGKVGSGFDVAAAVYGSCIYQRFPPSTLHAIPDAGSSQFVNKLRTVVESDWDMTVTSINVPEGLGLMMCDVDCGSATPGMVRSVLDWRSKDPSADVIWNELNRCNMDFMETLRKLGELKEEELINALGYVQNIHREQIPAIRAMIVKMGTAAGVPIEPESQTRLIDHTSKVAGVLGGVVPGAGGYDAVCFLYVDTEDTGEKLKEHLRGYKAAGSGKITPLNAREENEGVKVEKMEAYKDVSYLA